MARTMTVAAAVKAAATERRRVSLPDRKVAVIPLAALRRLRQLEGEAEDREDNAAVEASLAEPRPSIPWEQIKVEPGP